MDGSGGDVTVGNGIWVNVVLSARSILINTGDAAPTLTSNLSAYNSSATATNATITSVTDTGFNITFDGSTGTTGYDADIIWEAEGEL